MEVHTKSKRGAASSCCRSPTNSLTIKAGLRLSGMTDPDHTSRHEHLCGILAGALPPAHLKARHAAPRGKQRQSQIRPDDLLVLLPGMIALNGHLVQLLEGLCQQHGPYVLALQTKVQALTTAQTSPDIAFARLVSSRGWGGECIHTLVNDPCVRVTACRPYHVSQGLLAG